MVRVNKTNLTEPILRPTFSQAFWVWCRVAVLSFGGPAGQIAVMHRILVDEKRWISEKRFLHALNYCMLLPGPEAQQLATYIGWLLHRIRGGLTAGILFVLPGFLSILTLSILYAKFRDWTVVEGIFYGLKPAVIAVVIQAVIRLGRRALKNSVMSWVAAISFVAIFFFQVPFPLIIVAAAMVGFVGERFWPTTFEVINGHNGIVADDERAEVAAYPGIPAVKRSLTVLAIWLLIWCTPVLGLLLGVGPDHIFTQEALFFSQVSVVTFGGAYSVLAYVAQECVNTYDWLEPTEMLDGLGMAETTPGPLIQVVQFVGFMGAYRNPGSLSPMTAGIIGSLVTTWVTYAPCFLWIFLGAPYIEYLRERKSLNAALSTITAAVVGVILNLSVWFALHTLFGVVNEQYILGARLLLPDWATLDVGAIVITVAALIAIFRFRAGMIPILLASAFIGLLWRWLALVE
jgi:chromate transporter